METISYKHITMKKWADFMVPILEQFGNVGRLDDESKWQPWAAQLSNLPGLSGNVVPNPYTFAKWQDWVARFNENVCQVS